MSIDVHLLFRPALDGAGFINKDYVDLSIQATEYHPCGNCKKPIKEIEYGFFIPVGEQKWAPFPTIQLSEKTCDFLIEALLNAKKYISEKKEQADVEKV